MHSNTNSTFANISRDDSDLIDLTYNLQERDYSKYSSASISFWSYLMSIRYGGELTRVLTIESSMSWRLEGTLSRAKGKMQEKKLQK